MDALNRPVWPRETISRVDRSYIEPRNKAILDAYRAGASYEQLARRFSLARSTIRRMLLAERVNPNGQT